MSSNERDAQKWDEGFHAARDYHARVNNWRQSMLAFGSESGLEYPDDEESGRVMIIFQCQQPGCGHRESSRYGAEARDLIARHKQHCPDYRGINFLKEKTR